MKRKNYKWPNDKELNRFKRALPQLRKTQQYINKCLIDNIIIYIYKGKSGIETTQLQFHKANFMHLCGVKYYKRTSLKFWEDLLNHKLNLKLFLVKRNGSTFEKLPIINYLAHINDNINNLNITYGETSLYLKCNRAINSNRGMMSLALSNRYNNNRYKNIYYPYSLLRNNSSKYPYKSCQPLLD